MWLLIKTELKYNAGLFLLIGFACIAFTLSGLLEVSVFAEGSFLGKYFWSIIVALGSYFILLVYWTVRTTEKRDRLSALLPLTKRQISLVRYLLGVMPVLLVATFIELNRLVIPEGWHIYINRISSQLSMLFIFLSIVAIGMEYSLNFSFSSKLSKVVELVILFNLTAASIALYALDSYSHLPQTGVLGGRIFFYSWALITSFVAVRFFYNKSSYTD